MVGRTGRVMGGNGTAVDVRPRLSRRSTDEDTAAWIWSIDAVFLFQLKLLDKLDAGRDAAADTAMVRPSA